MISVIASAVRFIASEAAEAAVETNDPADLLPNLWELLVGFIAFFILFAFMAKWVLPKLNVILEERRAKIQGEMEKAEQTRVAADKQLADYKEQLAGARDEGNRIIEEARKTADQLRKDIAAKADQDAQATVAKASDEIRAERDRVFQELQRQVADLSVELAGVVVGQELDASRHEKLIDDYVKQVGKLGSGDASAN